MPNNNEGRTRVRVAPRAVPRLEPGAISTEAREPPRATSPDGEGGHVFEDEGDAEALLHQASTNPVRRGVDQDAAPEEMRDDVACGIDELVPGITWHQAPTEGAGAIPDFDPPAQVESLPNAKLDPVPAVPDHGIGMAAEAQNHKEVPELLGHAFGSAFGSQGCPTSLEILAAPGGGLFGDERLVAVVLDVAVARWRGGGASQWKLQLEHQRLGSADPFLQGHRRRMPPSDPLAACIRKGSGAGSCSALRREPRPKIAHAGGDPDSSIRFAIPAEQRSPGIGAVSDDRIGVQVPAALLTKTE